jgi:hypothetical protein
MTVLDLMNLVSRALQEKYVTPDSPAQDFKFRFLDGAQGASWYALMAPIPDPEAAQAPSEAL